MGNMDKNFKTIKELKNMKEIYPKRSIKEIREKGYKQALKDVLGLILLRINVLKQKQKECCDKWYCESCNVKRCIISTLEELKKRITGT